MNTKKYTLEELIDYAVKSNNEFIVIKAYDDAYFSNNRFKYYLNVCFDKYNEILKELKANEEVKNQLNTYNHKKHSIEFSNESGYKD